MLELLYTGEITATNTELEQIKTGLTLLGIFSPSEPPPPPPPPQQQQPRVLELDTSLAVGIINSSQVCFLLTLSPGLARSSSDNCRPRKPPLL